MIIRLAIRTLLTAAAVLSGIVAAGAPTGRPVDAGTGYRIDSAGMHLFLTSSFLNNIRLDRTALARGRYHTNQMNQAADNGELSLALAFCDSLIETIQHHRIRGLHAVATYRKRAQLLHTLGREEEACEAYVHTLLMQDSIMLHQQNDAAMEMQTTYELDRLALDQALLQARHHRTTLLSLLLLGVVIFCVVAIIFRSNRRTRRLQRKLLRKMTLAHTSEEQKTAFINSMCHEVRTPLNCLLGFSELLCSGEITPDIYAEYHEIIRESRHQLRYVLNDMLEVAYLENLNEKLPREYVDLCALCRFQLRTARAKYPRTEVVFSSDIPNEELGMATSSKYLSTLIAELIDNACKFTAKGNVSLECGRQGADKVYIAVADDGCGIPPEQQERIFERFVKLDTFSQGNGLGLYLCRLIVRHLGGEIRIDDSCTQGTRVVAVLPRK